MTTTKFIDALENILITNDIDWHEELKKGLSLQRKMSSYFLR